MKTFGAIWIGLALAAGLALAGCEDGVDDNGTETGKPSVNVDGDWTTKEDGIYLGVMSLDATSGGVLKGTLLTTQGSEAKLTGTLSGYAAEFTMTFPEEFYAVSLTFATNGLTASGSAKDGGGFTRLMTLARPAATNTNSI